MSPAGQKWWTFEFSLNPSQFFSWACLKEGSEIERVHIAETTVLPMASRHDEELVIDHARRMKPSCTRPHGISVEFDLSPSESLKVKYPKVIEVCHALSAKDSEIGVLEFCGMVGAFPGCSLILFGIYLYPLLGGPVEDVDRVESLFVGSASSEHYDLVAMRVIVHGAVRAMWGFVAGGYHFFPAEGVGVVGPEVVHIVGV